MNWLYDWVWNLVIYFILLTALNGVLPRSDYKKYIRLFTGALLILIILNPLLKICDLDTKTEAFFRKNSFELERNNLREHMSVMKDMGQDYVMKQYKEALCRRVEQLGKEHGVSVENVNILLEEDERSSEYGRILYMKMKTKGAGSEFIKMLATEFGMPEENINPGAYYE